MYDTERERRPPVSIDDLDNMSFAESVPTATNPVNPTFHDFS